MLKIKIHNNEKLQFSIGKKMHESLQPQVITFGCRLNSYESQVMKDLATEAGLTNTLIINTCAVTTEAERQARQSIRKLKRENPDLKIIVTGCASQINPSQFAQMQEVDRVLGNEEKMKLSSYLPHIEHERVLVNDIMSIRETAGHLVSGFEGKARAFVQIQNGCDHRCTFCTIPYGRGNSRSVPMGEIIAQVRHLIASGFQEIVFTGVDITAYGADLPGQPTLGQMIKRILALAPDLKRLRLSSLDPVEIDEDLWQLIEEEPRLLPHLHLSLQAGDNMILKRMKRRHLREDVIAFCQRAKQLRPGVAFGADLIAGFPTETDEMFSNTLKIVEECDLTFLHVFPYSARPNTPASRMPQVPNTIIKERAALLRAQGQQALLKFFQNWQGRTVTCLIETIANGSIQGKTDQFAPISISHSGQFTVGSIVTVTVTGYTQESLIGEIVKHG
jgi:threonylcarbamoyladenosine tRNA methylthiotransferase MtaB